ncbi:MAG: hypothetical protein ACRDKW_03055 [Actinomycetota bacterium]
MPGTLGSALIASILLASSAPAAGPPATPAGWIEDFCSDRGNWEKVEDWTGQKINSRADCQSALRGLRG